jgi:inhibitor of KinA sporulation pathway (predicted exonuclease)
MWDLNKGVLANFYNYSRPAKYPNLADLFTDFNKQFL